MPRIQPVTADQAPQASKPMLEAVQKKLGRVPNLLGTLAVSPAGLATYVKLNEALEQGSFDPKLRERIAVAVGAASGCEYCVSAHTAIGKAAGLPEDELARNLEGKSSDPKAQAAIDLARAIVETRGRVDDQAVQDARDAGLSDADVVETLAITMTNLFTNYANHLFETVNDFPKVNTPAAATN